MAVVTSYRPATTLAGLVQVTVFTPTQITLQGGSLTFNYYGSGFTTDGFSVTGGTVTSTDFHDSSNGGLQYTITGLDHSAATVAELLLSGDPVGVNGYLLGGHDVVHGSAFAEAFIAYSGNDVIFGNGGNDVLEGESGADRISGGDGADALFGGEDADVLAGDAGNDRLDGGTEADSISGGDGLDALLGGSGADVLEGNAGDDQLDGGIGADTMRGGAGNDRYAVDAAGDVVTEGAGAGLDTIVTARAWQLGANVENLTLSGATHVSGTGNTLNNVISGNGGRNLLQGGAGKDRLAGGGGNDTLTGGAGVDPLEGGTGNDLYSVDSTLEKIVELGGMDTVSAAVSGYVLGNGLEHLVLTGSVARGTGNAAANDITGNAARNTLHGLGGNDTLRGGAGVDTLFGGAGNDTYIVDSALDVVTDDGGAADRVLSSTANYTLATGLEQLTLTGALNSRGTGNDAANVLVGNAANNVLFGKGGNDTLRGEDGADTLDGGNDNDSLLGGSGNDSLAGAAGNDRLIGGAGADTLGGGDGDDSLAGDSENDNLAGGIGNDTLNGGTGADRLDGGSGNDHLLGGAGADTLGGGEGDDTLAGDADNDSLAGGIGSDSLLGGAGADTLDGGGEDDILAGGSENDNLAGAGGNDTLDGGSGADELAGGDGDDTYFIDGGDSIVELEGEGADTVKSTVSHALAAHFEDLVLVGEDDVDGTGNAGINLVDGNDGDNVLDGLEGADSLRGNGGDDVLVWDEADALIDGGAGVDLLRFTGAGVALDLSALPVPLSSIEIIDFSESGADLLTLVAQDISALSGTLRVAGGAGDTVIGGAGWTQLDSVTVDGEEYAQYDYSGTRLLVDLDVDRGGILIAGIHASGLGGDDGFRIPGVAAPDFAGRSVAGAGDFNGDGWDDVVIGAPRVDPGGVDAGAAYLVFGAAGGFGPTFGLSALDGLDGFRMNGTAAGDFAGYGVTGAGDMNGDGFADLVVGTRHININGFFIGGESYVVFGSAAGFGPEKALAELDGADGFRISGQLGQRLQAVHSAAGDVNGDGYGDLLVGAPIYGAERGAAYLIFGTASGFASNLDVATLDGSDGFQMTGQYSTELAGFSVSGAGDVNGDGFDDMVIGAPGKGDTGKSYVVFGRGEGFASEVFLAALDGTDGFLITGEGQGHLSGYSVSGAGDINGDGFADVLIGRSGPSPSGAAYVLFGTSTGFASHLHLSSLDGTNGFQVSGISTIDEYGVEVSDAGDMNGDGYDDFIIGAGWDPASGFKSGTAYVVFGRAGGFGSDFDLGSIDGSNGFEIISSAYDELGWSVDAAGDVNGDGFADVIVGAPAADGIGNVNGPGAAYVVFGRDFLNLVDFNGGIAADLLTGTGAAESFVGGEGGDTLSGGGGADVFRGGAGDDRIEIADGAFLDVDGGSGEDVLVVAGDLDLTAIANSKVAGIERIELGAEGLALELALDDVLALSGTSSILVIDGPGDADTDAEVIVADGGSPWTLSETVGDYAIYILGAATLKVHVGVDISINAEA
jgi:Ca2+-binding RTX toxin-like protein